MTHRKPNLCVILIPEGPDRDRVHAAVHRVADLAGGTPMETPHLTVAYLYGVTSEACDSYARSLESFARATRPMHVVVEQVIADWPTPYEGLLYAVRKTPALETLYDGLADQARDLGIVCNPSTEYRFEVTCVHLDPISASTWIPHIKVLKTFGGDRVAMVSLLQPLAADLSFHARTLWLSHLGEDGRWDLGQRFALDGRQP